jgi:hypothetical protein
MTRREFIRTGAAVGAAAAGVRLTGGATTASAPAKTLPTIKLGDLEVSRLLLGSNPFLGYSHRKGDWDKRMKEYYTDERIVAAMEEAAAHGITAVVAPPGERWHALWAKYTEGGGKLKTWIAQPHGKAEQMKEEIAGAVRAGAKAVFIQGQRVDEQVKADKLDVVRGWVEHVRTLNVPAGMASHRPDTHLEAQKRGFPVDFFFQCCYTNDDWKSEDRDRAVETIARLEKPVVAYKVLAAGANKPEDAFAFIFAHLRAKDGLCVGIFQKDDPGQIKQDAELTERFTKNPPPKPTSAPATRSA